MSYFSPVWLPTHLDMSDDSHRTSRILLSRCCSRSALVRCGCTSLLHRGYNGGIMRFLEHLCANNRTKAMLRHKLRPPHTRQRDLAPQLSPQLPSRLSIPHDPSALPPPLLPRASSSFLPTSLSFRRALLAMRSTTGRTSIRAACSAPRSTLSASARRSA